VDNFILFQNKAFTNKEHYACNVSCLKSISLTIQFSSASLITGSLLLFATIASLLCHQMLKFFCFITLITSISHFIAGYPPQHLPSTDHVIIRLRDLLSSMRTTCPYHFNILFSILLSYKKGKIRVGEDMTEFYHHLSAEKSHNVEVQVCYCNCVLTMTKCTIVIRRWVPEKVIVVHLINKLIRNVALRFISVVTKR
jgi:hypothetical protein